MDGSRGDAGGLPAVGIVAGGCIDPVPPEDLRPAASDPGDLTCTPWRKYGHDRVYVSRGEQRLGYLDRKTGRLSDVDPADVSAVTESLIAAGMLEAPSDPPFAPVVESPTPSLPVIDWAITTAGDAATYKPGAGLRAKAEEERAAAPVRSFMARVLNVHTQERAWRVGADGEELVAARLAKLPAPWAVVHGVPIGKGDADIDHVVVGPGGVFTLNTKNHAGKKVWVGGNTVLVGGFKQPYVRNSRFEAQRVSKILSAAVGAHVPVVGVVVVIAEELTIKTPPEDVVVVGRRRVRQWLEDQPVIATAEQVRQLERIIRTPTTWGVQTG